MGLRIKYLVRTASASPNGGRYEAIPNHPGCFVNRDAACDDYDWLVVYDDLPKGSVGTVVNGVERLACPPERTMLLTSEPVSVKCYGKAYARQFGHYLTNRPREAEDHPHYHFGRGYYRWYYGKPWNEVVSQRLPQKEDRLSVVCSAKTMRHTHHADRYRLVEYLSKRIPGFFWVGRGVKKIDHKYEALDPFKYHLAIENHIAPGHWSEKIVDALLAECLPFYAGDPMLGDVLPPESFIPVPIDDPPEAERIIRAAMAEGAYEKRLPAIREARRLILEKYNFWSQVLAVIEAEKNQPVTDPASAKKPFVLRSRWKMRRNPVAALLDGWEHAKRFLRGFR